MASFAISSLSHAGLNESAKNSSQQSSPSQEPTHALLSIRPQYAEAIFSGRKRFEFRRTIFRSSVEVVVVYITSPVSMVVGEFDVKDVISERVAELWDRTHRYAGIEQDRFFEYFSGRDVGYAIAIGDVRRYEEPVTITERYGVRAPQSFVYV